MPLSYEIVGGLLVVTAAGDYSFEEIRGLLDRAVADTRGASPMAVLADARASRKNPPVSELRATASYIGTIRHAFGPRVAIVVGRASHYGLGRMLQAFLEPEGLDLRIFRDLERARAWLEEPS